MSIMYNSFSIQNAVINNNPKLNIYTSFVTMCLIASELRCYDMKTVKCSSIFCLWGWIIYCEIGGIHHPGALVVCRSSYCLENFFFLPTTGTKMPLLMLKRCLSVY